MIVLFELAYRGGEGLKYISARATPRGPPKGGLSRSKVPLQKKNKNPIAVVDY